MLPHPRTSDKVSAEPDPGITPAAPPDRDIVDLIETAEKAGVDAAGVIERSVKKATKRQTAADRAAAARAIARDHRRDEGRPFWQLEKCPTWCKAHHDEDDVETHRAHGSVTQVFRIANGDPVSDRVQERGYGLAGEPRTPYFGVGLRMATGERFPMVSFLTVDGPDVNEALLTPNQVRVLIGHLERFYAVLIATGNACADLRDALTAVELAPRDATAVSS